MIPLDSAQPVAILLYSGVSGFEALGALSVFHAAGQPAEFVSAEALVHTREGARLAPHRLGYASLESAPVAVVPDGDVARLKADAGLTRALRGRRGKWTLASGAGVPLLHAAGLADERRVARLPGEPDLPGATSVASRLVADGRVLTCFPGDALVDLALHHLGRAHGDGAAQRAAQRLGRDYRPFAFGAAAGEA